MQRRKVFDCQLIHLPKIGDRKGQITAVNNQLEIPFDIKRVFYLYDIPAGESRGAHAHRQCHQLIVAGSGAFQVIVDDGRLRKVYTLDQPDLALHVPPGIWASLQNFSSGAVCMVLASHVYDEKDYIREYHDFIEYKKP